VAVVVELDFLRPAPDVMEEVVEEVVPATLLRVEQETVPQFHHHKEIMAEHLSLETPVAPAEAVVAVVQVLQEQLAMQVEMVEMEQHLPSLEHQ
jgi:hypothetical protein